MNKSTIINILICATLGAVLYYAFTQFNHYSSHQVFAGDAWTILLFLFFSYLVALIACVPIVWGMKKIEIYNPASVLVLSTLVVGVVIVFSNNGKLLQHPEGFVIGLIAGTVFLILERGNASNKAINFARKRRAPDARLPPN